MIQTLTKNWWLLALCGVLYALCSGVYLMIAGDDGQLFAHSRRGAIVCLGELTLAATACTIAASLWRSAAGKCWLLTVSGVAFGALGLIEYALTGFRIRFSTIALLIILMALSMGALEVVVAQVLRRQSRIVSGWSFMLAGLCSTGFALAFLALGTGWIEIRPGSHSDFLWIGSYFGFTGGCVLALAIVLHSLGPSRPGWRNQLA